MITRWVSNLISSCLSVNWSWGSRNGIEAEEKSVIDRCLPLVYQKYFSDPIPENMPVLGICTIA